MARIKALALGLQVLGTLMAVFLYVAVSGPQLTAPARHMTVSFLQTPPTPPTMSGAAAVTDVTVVKDDTNAQPAVELKTQPAQKTENEHPGSRALLSSSSSSKNAATIAAPTAPTARRRLRKGGKIGSKRRRLGQARPIDVDAIKACTAHTYLQTRGHGVIRMTNQTRYELWKYVDVHAATSGPPSPAEGLSLVTSMSTNRLLALSNITTKWDGPLSVSMLVCDASELHTALETFMKNPVLKKWVSLHVVVGPTALFPINTMRNVATLHAKTDYVFMTDVDSVPNGNERYFFSDLVRARTVEEEEGGDPGRTAFVVPAFEWTAVKVDSKNRTRVIHNQKYLAKQMVKTLALVHRFFSKDELTKNIMDGSMTIMHPTTPGYAAAFDLGLWLRQTKPARLTYNKDFEPYFVASKHHIPFDERFIGRGTNKIALMFEMFAAGWNLRTMDNTFVVDTPHVRKVGGITNQKYEVNREEIRTLFLWEVAQKYHLPCPAPRNTELECFWVKEYKEVFLGIGQGNAHFGDLYRLKSRATPPRQVASSPESEAKWYALSDITRQRLQRVTMERRLRKRKTP